MRTRTKTPTSRSTGLNAVPTNAGFATVEARPASAWRDRAIVGGIAVAASIAGVTNGFVFDDVPQVVENVRIQGLDRIGEILGSAYWPPPYAPELYRPVASIAAALQFVLGAGEPLVFRIVSYALYAFAAILVYQLARRLFDRRVALGVAALFAADPLHVEAVALAVNQGELIVACAALAAVIRYLDRRRSIHESQSDSSGLGARDWIVLAVLFAIGALSKENGFVIPALLVAAELTLIDGASLRRRLQSTWRGFATLAVVGIVLLVIRATVLAGSVTGALPAKAIAGLSLGGRLLTMLQIVPKWLRLLVWPAHLQIDYSPNEIVASTSFGAHELLGAIILAAFVALAVAMRRRAPVITFGLSWCAIALFPVSNIVPTGIVLAERTLFLPSVGFFIAVGGAVILMLRRFDASFSLAMRRSLAGICGMFVVVGVVRSDLRHRTWQNGQTMWAAAAIDAPRSLRVKQAHDEAVADLIRDFERATEQSPTPWRVQFQLGTMLRYMDADSAALVALRASLANRPNQADAALELAATLISTGRYDEAKAIAGGLRSSGDTALVAQRFMQLADSATAVNALPGSIRVTAREAFASLLRN